MPRATKKQITTGQHWLRVEATIEEIENEVLDRLELHERSDLVLRVYKISHDEMYRIDTPKCWCPDPLPITQPQHRMMVGRSFFRCPQHGRDVSVRRALDPLMKTPEARAKLLLENPVFRGIRDSLWKVYFAFQCGPDFIERSCNPHEATSLAAVGATKTRQLRGLLIEAINSDAADRAFENLDETAPWRTGLEDLIGEDGQLRPGWHLGPLQPEESFRKEQAVQREDHRRFLRGLKAQQLERAQADLDSIK